MIGEFFCAFAPARSNAFDLTVAFHVYDCNFEPWIIAMVIGNDGKTSTVASPDQRVEVVNLARFDELRCGLGILDGTRAMHRGFKIHFMCLCLHFGLAVFYAYLSIANIPAAPQFRYFRSPTFIATNSSRDMSPRSGKLADTNG